MSTFDSRLRHKLVIERFAGTGVLNDRNQETVAYSTLASVRGLVQPLANTGRSQFDETIQYNQAGAVVSDFQIFLPMTDVKAADRIRFEPDDGRRFEITGIRDEAGIGHHLKVMAKLVSV